MIGAAKAAPFLRQDLFTFICRFQRHFLPGQKKRGRSLFQFFYFVRLGDKIEHPIAWNYANSWIGVSCPIKSEGNLK